MVPDVAFRSSPVGPLGDNHGYRIQVVYPSWIKFQNRQEYEHENLLRKDHAAIERRLERIEEKLGVKKADE